MPYLQQVQQRVKALESEAVALCLAARHQATPWYAKLLIAGIVAYALSPIDLVPDFIPVLGLLDDLVLLPIGIALAIRLIPPAVMQECRAAAATALGDDKPVSWIAVTIVVAIWIGLLVLGTHWVCRTLHS